MKLLITGAWQKAEDNFDLLKKMGHEIVFHRFEKEELPCSYDWAEGIVCNGLFLHHPIEKFTNLKYIQLTSAGYDRIPMDYVKEKGIEIHNARGVYSIPMAEFAVAGVLQLYKQMRFFAQGQSEHLWRKHRGLLELYDKTVCIVGCGSVGTECASRFKAFGCSVVGVDLFPRLDESYDRMVPLEQLDQELPNADVLVLTLPLTEETRHLMNADRLGLLKENAVLVNIARGAVVDTSALIGRVDQIAGAVLDVFEEEPLREDSVLWNRENVILTPHNSFVGEGNGARLSKVILDNLGG